MGRAAKIAKVGGLLLLALLGGLLGAANAQYVTLADAIQGANGLPAKNYTLALTPSQIFYIAGTGVVVNQTVFCATSTAGQVVGTANPQQPLSAAVNYNGTLPAGNYYIEYAWVDTLGHVTLPSPEQIKQLPAAGSLVLSPPTAGVPATVAGMQVYIGTASEAETLQGTTASATANFTQSTPLVAGAPPPTSNTTVCSVVANDAGWPTGTGYFVTLTDPNGNTLPGYPMEWELLGPSTTIHLANGLPVYNGQVVYGSPILATPYNHAPQSIGGPLNLANYYLTGVGRLGVGTNLPGWGVDAEGSGANGQINAAGGFLVNGAAPLDHLLMGNGTAYVDTASIPYSLLSGSPTLYYQSVASQGTAQTQRGTLNFGATFVLSDSASPAETTVNLGSSGVTPGTYSLATVTVNSNGLVTAASGASATYLDQYATFPGCAFATDAANIQCTSPISVTFPQAFADTNYVVLCSQTYNAGSDINLGLSSVITGKTVSGFTYNENSGNNSALSSQYAVATNYDVQITCHAHHN